MTTWDRSAIADNNLYHLEIEQVSETLERPGNALVVIAPSQLPTILAADEGDLLGKLRAQIEAFTPDASTPAGRDEIRKTAADVSRTKTALEKIADSLTESWRKSHLAVVAEKKALKERLDALRDSVRAPLTEYESIEKERVAGHEAAIAAICNYVTFDAGEISAADIAERIVSMEMPERDWKEFGKRAAHAFDAARGALARMHDAAVKREAEAAELARFRAEQEEQERKAAEEARRHREAELARKAAEAATAAAEQRAAAERAEMERKAQTERDAAAKRERDAIDAAERAKLAAENAERRQAEAAESAEAQRKADAAAAERRQTEAIAAERRRHEEVVAAERAEADRRATDKAHKAKINREALQDLCGAANLTSEQAQNVVVAIASRKVRHVAVSY